MDKKDSNFEEKLDKSKQILETLMNPDITLQKSVQAYKDGIKELQEAQKMLDEATLTIKEIKNT